jgi:hypothetical protein
MMTQPGLECPQCGKHSLVQRTNDVYLCLNCNFKKDLAAPPPKKSNFRIVPFIGLSVLLLLALRSVPKATTPAPQPASSIERNGSR